MNTKKEKLKKVINKRLSKLSILFKKMFIDDLGAYNFIRSNMLV